MHSSLLTKIYDFHGNSLDIFNIFVNLPNAFFLDSSLFDPQRGRYSLIGFEPFEVISGNGFETFEAVQKKWMLYRSPSNAEHSPFFGGAVGFLSYDLCLNNSKIKKRIKEIPNIPECYFAFYESGIIIDHLKEKVVIFSTGLPEGNEYLRGIKSRERLKEIERQLRAQDRHLNLEIRETKNVEENALSLDLLKTSFSKGDYLKAAEKVLQYIESGDIYQLNLSRQFEFALDQEINLLGLYQHLREFSPSCFGAYFNADYFQILSSSPEEFLRMNKNLVTTYPMKGTRPRGKTPLEDKRYKDELINSPKEVAELLMITDLMRNDLGRVCMYDSIKVKTRRRIEEYKTVFQAVSMIEGRLKQELTAWDLLKACFPGGSITGAPKLRSTQIIEELEPHQRGIYTGTLGYIGFNGDLNFNMLIRTLLVRGDNISFCSGSGIVADSNPEAEYEEMIVKTKAIRWALGHVLSKGNFCRGTARRAPTLNRYVQADIF